MSLPRSGMAAILALLLLAASALPASAQTPNHSVLFYRPGIAVTGTLKAGTFTQKASFRLKRVSLAAATRSSLALYTKGTGRLRTGTFRNGIFRQREAITIRPGFTHVAGSCDTVFFYNTLTGRALAGTLVKGRFRNRTSYQLQPGWTNVTASCDTAWLSDVGKQSSLIGGLSGGDWSQIGSPIDPDSFAFPLQAATRDSVLSLARGNAGHWGTLTAGTRDLRGYAGSFATWDLVAGTASTLQFYRSDGLEARAKLVGGIYTLVGSSSDYSSGWRIIVGGR
jgi:hypothetical protein